MSSFAQNTSWIPFYEEFANKLLSFKNERKTLISLIETAFTQANVNLPKLEAQMPPTDIDPFTVFGLFNKQISLENRNALIAAFADKLNIETAKPESFDGVPTMNNLNATFYRFLDKPERAENDIDDLWQLFECALTFADNPSEANRNEFTQSFDKVKDLKGNRWKLTIGLYWIRPNAYVSLDSRNRWYVKERSNINQELVSAINALSEIPNANDYLVICEGIKKEALKQTTAFHDFPSFSFTAWKSSEEENARLKTLDKDEIITDVILEDNDSVHYWLYSPGANAYLWDELRERGEMAIGWEEIGDLSKFASKEEMKNAMRKAFDASKSYRNSAHATWQFANEMKPGDIIFVKKGMREIIGRGVVTSEYRFEPSRGTDRSNIREINWTHSGSWLHPDHQAAMKTLTDITPYTDYVSKLEALFEIEEVEIEEEAEAIHPAYSKDDFLNDVFMSEDDYEKLVSLVRYKKNVILQGAPGVGKTYCAKRLAYSMMGVKDPSRVMMVQFHQSYSYEDFIEGYRPSGSGFELRKGPFYRFCKKAEIDNDNDYFFIIDEINRGNLSKIFGELFMLIEADKRGVGLNLLYSDEEFSVPKNVKIIGMMNTADRSLAMLDYALRRRFAFFEISPGFDSDGFNAYAEELSFKQFDTLTAEVKLLNQEIIEDDMLGRGFVIGHSYFCGIHPDRINSSRLESIVHYELIPLLEEYWYDEPDKVREWSHRLDSAIE